MSHMLALGKQMVQMLLQLRGEGGCAFCFLGYINDLVVEHVDIHTKDHFFASLVKGSQLNEASESHGQSEYTIVYWIDQ